jgi:hypothetical protein
MTAEDLVIQDLADGEAAALEHVARLRHALAALERERYWLSESLRVCLSMLARTTYERDRALASLYERARVPTVPVGTCA